MTQPSGRVPAPEPLPADALDAHCHLDLIEQPVGEVLAAARAARPGGYLRPSRCLLTRWTRTATWT